MQECAALAGAWTYSEEAAPHSDWRAFDGDAGSSVVYSQSPDYSFEPAPFDCGERGLARYTGGSVAYRVGVDNFPSDVFSVKVQWGACAPYNFEIYVDDGNNGEFGSTPARSVQTTTEPGTTGLEGEGE